MTRNPETIPHHRATAGSSHARKRPVADPRTIGREDEGLQLSRRFFGHGAVAGACITVLKFFFKGDHLFQNPLVPISNGTATAPYAGPDAGSLSVNGELHKLASNISFGHDIHAGIHWRSDTDTSIQLGEAVALSYLRNRARTYNEQFSISITKLDGKIATISTP